jgi:excisionase family DNA binding protein
MDAEDEYLTIAEAARYLGLTPGHLRRVLRQYGLGEILRASMRKQVTIRKSDLHKLGLRGSAGSEGRGVA